MGLVKEENGNREGHREKHDLVHTGEKMGTERNSNLSCVIVYLILTLLLTVPAVQGGVRNPHRFPEKGCARCHRTVPNGEQSAWTLVAPETQLCTGCHRSIDLSLSHPVGIRPVSVRVPVDMPLSPEGFITCSTCHDVHALTPTPWGNPYLLRHQESGVYFCTLCHRSRLRRVGTHAEALQKAHFKVQSFPGSSMIDPVSRECLSCHDGAIARFPVVSVGLWRYASFSGTNLGRHPIGIDYEETRRRRGRLRPVFTLDKRIKLIQGKVSCVSCHEPFSERNNGLVMDNWGSRLCLECHQK
ncbi:MAG: hypothetical protein D6736_22065 [Nitrospinota bacterium]|nr:MAG: hypothetical protein D6736_22065 [Nitrospinota bacterium]